ncbi:MAG: glycosyltransferase family 2 protein [Candidatus Cryptobacteroides sp.]
MYRIAVLISVYNKKEKVLACLEECYRQFDSMIAEGKYRFTIYLHDDNSTDGLREDVKEKFPETNILRTYGKEYINGGRLIAWRAAAKENYDFYLWLDCELNLKENAFSVLLDNSAFVRHKAIIVGSVAGPKDGMGLDNISPSLFKTKYGGRNRIFRLIEPDKVLPVVCEIFDGNLVLVPKYAYDIIGMFDPRFPQTFGDYDYALRAKKAGVARLIAPGILATVSTSKPLPVWKNPNVSLKERYKALDNPAGRPLKAQFNYDLRSNGLFFAIMHFFKTNIVVLFAVQKIY